ncbi:MAG: hypothetical protein DWQ30_25500 [Acidobacteria bacterium]|nr:MAG: hypothetical protein DWQ30_25500 [Acidobacteriota bacterium]
MAEVGAPGLGWLDLVVLLGVLVAVTVIADRLAGRAQGARDFFLGGRRLPWYAVSASIIATEISAVTFISLPSVVYRPGGDLTYLQIVLAYGVSRCLVAWLLVPRYLEREVFSPYEYLGTVLGRGARRTATGLFLFGGVLAQGARVYLTALILQVLLGPQLEWVRQLTGLPTLLTATLMVVAVALLWTLLGGIATVIWTDALLSLLLVVGLIVSLVALTAKLPGDWVTTLQAAGEAGKLRLLEPQPSWTAPYTLLAALLGATVGGVGAFGTDQLVAQRLFCCRSVREARWAMVASFAGIVITAMVMLLGLGLWRYSASAEWAAAGSATAASIAAQPDRVFPVFILWDLPAGLRALVIAGARGAAVSSLDSILTALAQGTLSLLGDREASSSTDATDSSDGTDDAVHAVDGDETGAAEASTGGDGHLGNARTWVVLWAVVLGAVGMSMAPLAVRYRAILDLALAMAGLTGGALLAGVLLAVFGGRDRRRGAVRGARYRFAAPLSALVLIGVVAHSLAAQVFIALLGAALIAWRISVSRRGALVDGLVLAVGAVGALALSRWGLSEAGAPLAWPWYVPLGAAVTALAVWAMRLDPRQGTA